MPILFITSATNAPNDQTGLWVFLVILMAVAVFSSLLFTTVMVAVVASLGGSGKLIVLGAIASCLSIWGLILATKRFRREKRRKRNEGKR